MPVKFNSCKIVFHVISPLSFYISIIPDFTLQRNKEIVNINIDYNKGKSGVQCAQWFSRLTVAL